MTKRYLGNIITQNPTAPAGDLANSAAKGVWSLEEQLAYQKAGLWPVPGNFPLDVEDVFSTYLFTPNTSGNFSVTNNIDLDGEGGLVWLKQRDVSANHLLYDTNRGASAGRLASNLTNSEALAGVYFDAFNSDGFTVKDMNNDEMASWTFRKAPKFFTCLTYTGTGSAQNISHDLGSDVGFMVIKRTDTTGFWIAWHKDLASTTDGRLLLNTTDTYNTSSTYWNSTAPTSTGFTVGTNTNTNASGGTYVAYLFAHNNGDGEFGADGDADIIKCGAATNVNGSGDVFYDLGFEPQWLLWKQTNTSRDWYIFDNMRGVATGGVDAELRPSKDDAEDAGLDQIDFNATGFTVRPNMSGLASNGSSDFIYMAIRRGTKVPESATEVFNTDANGGTSSGNAGALTSGFPVDLAIYTQTTGGYKEIVSRLNSTRLFTNVTNAENAASRVGDLDFMDGFGDGTFASDYVGWMWKRAPGYFDAVAYSGSIPLGQAGSSDVSHNLGVAPEMMWVKVRDATNSWAVYHSAVGPTKFLTLDTTGTPIEASTRWNDTAPTSSVFTLGNNAVVNQSGNDYIAYLFASLPGISKVGSYTGNSTGNASGITQTIDCGFTSGARFVLIKKTNGTGSWVVFDTERGIVSGNDPYLKLNETTAESTVTDAIDPHSSGFTLTSSTLFNSNGDSYIFYAIA